MTRLIATTTTDGIPSAQQQKAATLRALHAPGDPLVLPNAWDAASARMVESAGFPVVATSSAATAAVLGHADGEDAPVEEVLAAAARIAGAVNVPVTVDFERGYRLAPAELVERFAATGAVGLNLEDSDPSSGEMVDAAEQADFLAAIRAEAVSLGVDLVINARTDSFLRRAGSPGEQLTASIERGARYLTAGADCVYPIAASDPAVIRTLVEQVPGPLNVAYGQGLRSLAELAALGVARVSFGPALQRHLYDEFGSALLSAVASDENPFALGTGDVPRRHR
ncbi:isocitrate lyase/PEP mutase family protein [Pseudonocardia nigra]|uniref:isocitrate lyase/PEP mutase family protein n=1 Tax=Pseudonocardia nigra TaxID=1921578 RepID=UPI001C5D10F5|nr:isocitrate lyase/phosphoenolpyruvate mutase family protein [Pseudonocardia nigra]